MARKTFVTGTNVSAQSYGVYTGKCTYHGFRLGMDGTNDVTLTIKDGNIEILPTNTYDASVLGLNGEVLPTQAEITCDSDITVVATCTGTFELIVIYNELL